MEYRNYNMFVFRPSLGLRSFFPCLLTSYVLSELTLMVIKYEWESCRFSSHACVLYDCYYLNKKEILRLIVCIVPYNDKSSSCSSIRTKWKMSVVCIYNLVKEKWLIDSNNTFLYKENVYRWIIRFWSSDQPPFFSVEYHLPNYQYVDFDASTYSFPFLYSRTSQVIDPYGRGVYIYMLLNSAAQSQSIFALSSFEK
jgi:hypothetical protein